MLQGRSCPLARAVVVLTLLGGAGPAMAQHAAPAAGPRAHPSAQVGSEPSITGGLVREWFRPTYGAGIGTTGLHAVDLDADGKLEIVAAAGRPDFWPNSYWYVVGFDGAAYTHRWASVPYLAGIGSVQVAQADADAALEVFVAAGGRIHVYDGATLALQQTIETGAEGITGLSVANLDGAGGLELVFTDSRSFATVLDLCIYDLEGGTLLHRAAGLGGLTLAIGQLDGDAPLEIVTGNGANPGYVIDGASRGVEWTLSSGFGRYVRTGDVDGDGRDEIVAGIDGDPGIRVYDADLQTLAASRPVFDIDALRVLDVDGDGDLEIVYGDGQWGGVHALALVAGNLTELWSIANPDNGVTDIAAGDVDGDGTQEIVFGAGATDTGPDHLHVAGTVSHAIEWESLDISGPFLGLDHGDVDGDGEPEILYSSLQSDSGNGGGLFFVHDAVTRALEYQSAPNLLNTTGLWRVRHANVDADPQAEIFVTTSQVSAGLIVCYDGLTHAAQWQSALLPNGQTIVSLEPADVDGDGSLELVAGIQQQFTGPAPDAIHVYDAATGAPEWQAPLPAVGSPLAGKVFLRVADVTGDSRPEIVAAAVDSLYVVDTATHGVLSATFMDVSALDTPDRNGDGKAEIVIGAAAGSIRVVHPITGLALETVGTYEGAVQASACWTWTRMASTTTCSPAWTGSASSPAAGGRTSSSRRTWGTTSDSPTASWSTTWTRTAGWRSW